MKDKAVLIGVAIFFGLLVTLAGQKEAPFGSIAFALVSAVCVTVVLY